jgi:hypothetical protein
VPSLLDDEHQRVEAADHQWLCGLWVPKLCHGR